MLANMCRRHGCVVFGDRDDEVAVSRGPDKPDYYCDLVAICGTRTIVIEVDGYEGHRSAKAIRKDAHRTEYIKENLKEKSQLEQMLQRTLNGKVELYRFAFWQLTNMEEDIIIQELKLNGSQKNDKQAKP